MVKEKGKDNIYWTNEEPVIIRVNGKEHIEMQPTSKSLCVIDGVGFGVTKDGFTFCAGQVREVTADRHQNYRDNKEVVSKPPISSLPSGNHLHAQNNGGFETFKNLGGRPRKKDNEISRTTRWRRKKELQGVLL